MDIAKAVVEKLFDLCFEGFVDILCVFLVEGWDNRAKTDLCRKLGQCIGDAAQFVVHFFVGMGQTVKTIQAFVHFAHESAPAFTFARLLIEGLFEESHKTEACALEELVCGPQGQFHEIGGALWEQAFVLFDAFEHIAERDVMAAKCRDAFAKKSFAMGDGFETFGEDAGEPL